MLEKSVKKRLAGGGGGTVVLMIGLYLIILAFFILLNAISESSDANYEKASNSLKASFGFTSGEVEPSNDDVNITIEEFYSGIAKKLTGIVASYFPANSYDLSFEIGKIIIVIPTDRFFDDNSTTVNPMIYSFFFDMIRMLNNLVEGLEIAVEINVQTQGEEYNSSQEYTNLKKSSLRASDMANIMKSEASRFKELQASVDLGQEDLIHFYIIFDIHDYQKALLSYRDFVQ